MSSDEGGLRRWARRKAQAKQKRGSAAPVVAEAEGDVPAMSGPKEVAGREEPAEDLPADLDLPDIETLKADSDFSAFMKEGVPPALRRLALRKLWASDTMFNVIDEMVEYGEDYSNAALVADAVQSAWEPGKGYAKEVPPADEPVSGSEEPSVVDDGEGRSPRETGAADAGGSKETGASEDAGDDNDDETELG